jgi:hypothetical protein
MCSIPKNFSIYGLLLGLAFIFMMGCSDSQFTTEGCNGPDCENTQLSTWDVSAWSTCDLACGGGTQTRTVRCKDAQGNVTPDGNCSGAKPAVSQICNVQACVSDYEWLIGDWGTCTKTCGGGTQSRSILCKYKDGTTAADNKCPTPKPSTEQICNSDTCPKSYDWKTTDWSACSKSCGNGTQTRIVYCADQFGSTADASKCTGTKPVSEQLCNTQACTATYSWLAGDWSSCSKTCGGGTKSRSVSCQRDDGQFVNASFCTATKPAESMACNTQACVGQCTDSRSINASIEGSSSMLDILLVVDDSGSMAADNLKLANKLKGFADDLTNRCKVDWQMCVTTTDVDYYKGRPIMWQGLGSHILKPTTPNLETVFVNTIKWIGSGWSNDEQGIKAMNMSVLDNFRSKCYRPNASISVIVISDEDERSVGGNASLSTLQYKPLEALNQPASFPKTVKDTFGNKKKFNVNSIIVKDAQCKASQDSQGAGAKSFYGTKYQALSNLTGGGLGSICSADYKPHLNLFANHIVRTMSSIDLQCNPVKVPSVTIRPVQANQSISLLDNQLIFTPVIKGPAEITGSYCCAQ